MNIAPVNPNITASNRRHLEALWVLNRFKARNAASNSVGPGAYPNQILPDQEETRQLEPPIQDQEEMPPLEPVEQIPIDWVWTWTRDETHVSAGFCVVGEENKKLSIIAISARMPELFRQDVAWVAEKESEHEWLLVHLRPLLDPIKMDWVCKEQFKTSEWIRVSK